MGSKVAALHGLVEKATCWWRIDTHVLGTANAPCEHDGVDGIERFDEWVEGDGNGNWWAGMIVGPGVPSCNDFTIIGDTWQFTSAELDWDCKDIHKAYREFEEEDALSACATEFLSSSTCCNQCLSAVKLGLYDFCSYTGNQTSQCCEGWQAG